MTFHRAIFVSFSIHILVCGGALAFAEYGHIIGMRSDTILVSLVGSGPVSRLHEQEEGTSDAKRSQERPVPAPNTEQSRMDDPAADRTAVKPMEIAGADVKHQLQKTGGEPGPRFGILTPDQWQLIQAALERAKNYPRMARERGIEGIVRVRFKVLLSGDVERVEILKSSGHEILDSASVKTVYRSRPLPHVTGWVEVPIAYVLK